MGCQALKIRGNLDIVLYDGAGETSWIKHHAGRIWSQRWKSCDEQCNSQA
jgi:hypothetical protein